MDELTIKVARDVADEITRWIDEESTGEMLVGSPKRFMAMTAMRRAIREADAPKSERRLALESLHANQHRILDDMEAGRDWR